MSNVLERANETTVPVLPCVSVEDTVAFFRALGFAVTYQQTKPYVYLALRWQGFELHYGSPPKSFEPEHEDGAGCLVMVDEVAPYHAAFVQAMREAYGKVLGSGRPRVTRFRPGASRFTLVDPSGNAIIFIQRDEPAELEYGGSKSLNGLAKALDNARIFREFKNDDRAALRALRSGLRRHSDQASDLHRATALAAAIDLATHLGETGEVDGWRVELKSIRLTPSERRHVKSQLPPVDGIDDWLG